MKALTGGGRACKVDTLYIGPCPKAGMTSSLDKLPFTCWMAAVNGFLGSELICSN